MIKFWEEEFHQIANYAAMQHEPWGVEETIFNRYIKRLIKISAKMKSGFEACAIPQNNFGDGTAGPAKGEKRGLKSTQRGTVPELRDAHVDIARRGRASIRPTALRRDFEFILGDPLLIVERLSPRSEFRHFCLSKGGEVTAPPKVAAVLRASRAFHPKFLCAVGA